MGETEGDKELMPTENKWKRHVIPFTVSLFKRQIKLINSYKERKLIVSKSEFVRNAVDHYFLRFEKIVKLTETAEVQTIFDQKIRVPRSDDDFLKENGITVVRRLEY